MKILFSTIALAALVLGGCALNGKKEAAISYNEICEKVEGTTAQGDFLPPVPLQNRAPDRHASESLSADPSLYTSGTDANDIALARRKLASVRNHYERFECDKENDNKVRYDRPLILTALVAGGAALAKANAYILGGIGLAAGGIATFKSYEHPDVDRDAFLEAYKELTCGYDETHSLPHNLSVETLWYDRTTLQSAISAVSAQISKVPTDSAQQNAQQKALVKAANAALDAGNAAVTAIDNSLRDYANLATTIYKVTDAIDINARTKNKTNGTYASFSASIKEAYSAAGKGDAAQSDAKKKVDAASGAMNVATAVKPSTTSNSKSNKTDLTFTSLFDIRASSLGRPIASNFISACIDKTGSTCSQILLDSTNKAINSQTRGELRASRVISDANMSDVSKLVALASIATEDLPSPSYSDVIANLTACLPKQ